MVRNEEGVSLVETVLVLAIAGVLAATVLFGRDSTRVKLQFGQSMDQWVQVLSQASTESSATVGNNNITSATAGQGNHVLGKLVTIQSGSTSVQVDTVLSAASGSPPTEAITDVGNVAPNMADSYSSRLPWSVTPTAAMTPGPSCYILFAQSSVGIVPQVYVLVAAPTSGTFMSSLSGSLLAAGSNLTIPMADKSGNSGSIVIDASGNVTRTIN